MRLHDSIPRRLLVAFVAVIPAAVFASHHVVSPTTSASNEKVEIKATISMTEQEVAQKLGADPGKGVVLVEVHVSPLGDKPLRISPDDFILLAHDDGQRSEPYDPAQLAGSGALVVSQSTTGGSMQSGRVGIPGMPIGLPNEPVVGGSAAGVTSNVSKMNSKDSGNVTLLDALKLKQLKDVDTTNDVTGYLYFPLDGKHKLKNMALLYRGQGGRIDLEFQH